MPSSFEQKVNENEPVQVESEKVLALADEGTNNTDMESLDQLVKSMMPLSENFDPYRGKGRARICKVCGKEGSMTDIMNHIEAHHIAGISIPCGLCGKVFRTRNAQTQHKSKYHRNQQYDTVIAFLIEWLGALKSKTCQSNI